MKTKVSVFPSLAAGLAVATFFAGCEYPVPPPRAVRIIHTRPSLAAVPAEKPAPPELEAEFKVKDTLSKTAAEVLKMYESGVGAEVLAAHVKHSPKPFQLAADQIIYFNDLGVPDAVTTAMIERDQALGHTAEEISPNKAPAAGKQPNPPAEITSTTTQTIVVKEPAAVTTQVFYTALSPYGTWMHVDEYGWVWQPTAATVNVHWRPYYDLGHWMYTDAGWYWHSGYSWGWAPFHYGRWSLHSGHGWIWVPGTVWSPSWVSFRYTNNYCGWAPLPPRAYYSATTGFTYHGSRISIGFDFGLSHRHYTFVSRKHFGHHHHHRRRIDHKETQQVFKDSTVVNNYIVGDNNTIINKGISRDRVAGGNFSEIRKIALRDVAAANQAVRPSRTANQNAVIPVYRPKVIDKQTGPTENQLARQRTRPTQKRILSRSKTIPTPSRSITPQPSRNRISTPSYTRKPIQPANNNSPTQRRTIQPIATPRTTTLPNRNRTIPTPSRNVIPSYRNKTVTPQYQTLRPSTSGRLAPLPKTTARPPSRQMTTPRRQVPAPTYRSKQSPARTYAPPQQQTSRPRILSRSKTIPTPSRNRVTPQPSRSQISPPSYTRKPIQPANNNTPTQRQSIQPITSPRTSSLQNRSRAIPTPSRSITPSYRNKTVTPRSQAPTPTYRPKSPTRTYAPPQRSRPQEVKPSVPSRNRVAMPSRSRSIPSRNTSPSRARSIPQRAKSVPSK